MFSVKLSAVYTDVAIQINLNNNNILTNPPPHTHISPNVYFHPPKARPNRKILKNILYWGFGRSAKEEYFATQAPRGAPVLCVPAVLIWDMMSDIVKRKFSVE